MYFCRRCLVCSSGFPSNLAKACSQVSVGAAAYSCHTVYFLHLHEEIAHVLSPPDNPCFQLWKQLLEPPMRGPMLPLAWRSHPHLIRTREKHYSGEELIFKKSRKETRKGMGMTLREPCRKTSWKPHSTLTCSRRTPNTTIPRALLPHARTPDKKKALPEPLNQNTSSHCHEHPDIAHVPFLIHIHQL